MTTKIFQKTRGLLSAWSDPVNIYYKLSPNGGVKYRPTPATTTQQIQHITLFPNPAETVLTLNGVGQTGEYAIFDITGKAALRGSASANRIEVATLPPGSYMLHFSQGKATYHLKFIKKINTMKQIRIILLISITLACSRGYAQIGNHIPQYAAYWHPLNGRYNGTYSSFSNNNAFNSTKRLVNACIYPPGSFAAPAGKITHIYVTGNNILSYNAGFNYYTPIPMRMGQTALRTFDTFYTPLQLPDTTAVKALLYSLPKVSFTDSVLCIDSASIPLALDMYPPHNQRIWVKIKLDHPIPYDPTKSLVIAGDLDVGYGEGSVKGGALKGVRYTEDSSTDYSKVGGTIQFKHYYTLAIRRDTLTGKISNVGAGKIYMDLGFDIEPLSVSELYAQQHVHRAYPNPAADKLTIEGIERVGAYQIYDLMGRKALQGNTAGDAIPVNSLPPGMYLLRFMQGAVQQQIKFMKE